MHKISFLAPRRADFEDIQDELKRYSSAVFEDPDQDGIYNAMKKLNFI